MAHGPERGGSAKTTGPERGGSAKTTGPGTAHPHRNPRDDPHAPPRTEVG